MSHVFISYKNEDVDFAENVKSRLKDAGFTAWIDDAEIGAGEEWRTKIDQAVGDALALIVIMTPEAKASEYVTYEWAFALGAGVKVIPVKLKETELHPRLKVLQHLDFTNTKNRPWIKLIEEVQAVEREHRPRNLTLYDSRNGFQLRDFRVERWEGAKGTLDLGSSPDPAKGALVFDRENTSGEFVAWLQSYAYKNKPKVIPVGDSPDPVRRLQISCEVRARQADHTLLVTLKVVGAPMGEHLTQWHHRITPEGWIDIDHDVEKPVSGNCQFRFQDRSVSAVPSRLEIRRLVVTEREPPQSLLPLSLRADGAQEQVVDDLAAPEEVCLAEQQAGGGLLSGGNGACGAHGGRQAGRDEAERGAKDSVAAGGDRLGLVLRPEPFPQSKVQPAWRRRQEAARSDALLHPGGGIRALPEHGGRGEQVLARPPREPGWPNRLNCQLSIA